MQRANSQEIEKLDKTKEYVQKKNLDIERIEEIVAKPTLIGNKVTVDKDDFDMVIAAAQKYVIQEKMESALQRALDAANKMIAELKKTVLDLKTKLAAAMKELSENRSVNEKIRAAELERENNQLRSKIRAYDDVIDSNNLRSFFSGIREKVFTKDNGR